VNNPMRMKYNTDYGGKKIIRRTDAYRDNAWILSS